MSLDLALSIARGGLAHVNRGMAASADNVANAATPGRTRQAVAGRAREADGTSGGVRSLAARREVDGALVSAIGASRAATAAAAARAGILRDVELAHGRPEAGESVGDLTNALRDALVAANAAPVEELPRAAVVNAADALARRYNAVSDAIGTARQSAQDGMVEGVERLNAALRRVAAINERVRPLAAAGASTASLQDERDAAIAELSDLMEVRTIQQADGGVMLLGRGGLVLPLHPDRDAFGMAPATVGPNAYHGAGGVLPGVMLGGTDVTASLGRGRLAALAELRDRTLPLMAGEIDVGAANLAARFDAQGMRLFTDGTGAVPDAATPHSTGGWIGFAGTVTVNPGIRADPRGIRDGTHAVAGAPGGATAFTPNPAGGPAAFTAALDRALAFALGANVSAGNPHPGFATSGLGPAGDLSSSLTSPRTLADHAASVVARQTGLRALAEEDAGHATSLRHALEERFGTESGVDVDAEMAAMVTLQTAYAANARIIGAVQAMYDQLLQAVR